MELIIAITGSSGVVYGKKLIEVCSKKEIKTNLIISPAAEKIMKFELEDKIDEIKRKSTNYYGYKEIGAPIASGSVKNDGMIIVPCSMKTIGSIASGIADNLITRAADVALKENRKLILVPRETPLHAIHLDNLTKLKKAGATILPASPGFYHKPKSIEDLVNFVVGKILDQIGIEHQLYQAWRGL